MTAGLSVRDDQNTKGRWAAKVSKWTSATASGDLAFKEEHRYDGVVRVAFPELADLVPEVEREYFNEDDLPPF